MNYLFRNTILYISQWTLLSVVVGVMAGSASAVFLWLLNEATDIREANVWIIAFLPLGGLWIGYFYYKYGAGVVKGNNQILEEYHAPQKIIPLRMAPMILLGTVITHLFGGSAGREGTAVQMGGALADQTTQWLGLSENDRKIVLLIGVSGGFASVFGTPWAGAVFALEVFLYKKVNLKALFPVFLTAFVADFICHQFGVHHTQYSISDVPHLNWALVLWGLLAGVIFGLAAMLFSRMTHFWGDLFHSKIYFPPLRPMIGGTIIALTVYFMGTTKYIGLGIPVIVDSFSESMNNYDFLVKALMTSFTLGAGFKGGEVTPLFFIGATLGNVLVAFIPLPVALLAGMGFVAVFAGATHAPLACTLMGLELFGLEAGAYLFMACMAAYLVSGNRGIYSSQPLSGLKKWVYHKGL